MIKNVTGAKYDAIEAAVSIDPEASEGKLTVVRYKKQGDESLRRVGKTPFVLPASEIAILMADQDACIAKACEFLGVELAD